MTRRARILGHAQVARLVTSSSEGPVVGEPRPAPEVALQWLPDWVAEAGVAASDTGYWLWASPTPSAAPDADNGEPRPSPSAPAATQGQVVLELPPGRYMVDVLDSSTGQWISRESCAASPLVAGLPSRGAPLVVRIAPLDTAG